MVRISSTGEILPDDPQPRNRGSGDAPQQRQGSVRHENYNEQEQQEMQGEGGQVSIFDSLNQRLLALGLPRWNAGPYVIEPIVSVAFLLAGLFLGIPGLLMGLVLFGVVKLSQSGGIPGQDLIFGLGRNQNQNTNHRNPGNNRKPRGGGGGHRLGRT
ncbi:protein FAM241B [Patella vulgata]|uniref:protein FAM241B n=1 Tax=Patella vulgata TaxID=6465 RepID=UPI0021802357|nr:protein FAM241B [Patella vulgata]